MCRTLPVLLITVLPSQVQALSLQSTRRNAVLRGSMIPALFNKNEYDVDVTPVLDQGISALKGKVGVDAFVSFLENTHPEPEPREFVDLSGSVDFSVQPYAEQMLVPDGLSPMTDAQKVWSAEYFDQQLWDGIESLPVEIVDAAPLAVKALTSLPPLTEAALFDKDKYDADVIPVLDQGISALKGKAGVEVFVSFLENTRAYFFMLMNFPRSHFYLGMTDALAMKLGGTPEPVQVQIEATRMMHPLMDEHARAKSDRRRDTAATFFKCLYDACIATQPGWNLNTMLTESSCASDDVKNALQSMSPMISFPIEQGSETLYVLMEGNGRIGGLKAAVDLLISKHSNFMPPNLTINVIKPGHEKKDEMLMKNLLFFLSLNWRTQFPNVDLEGWTRQEPASLKPVSDEFVAIIRESPRYFGYTPA